MRKSFGVFFFTFLSSPANSRLPAAFFIDDLTEWRGFFGGNQPQNRAEIMFFRYVVE